MIAKEPVPRVPFLLGLLFGRKPQIRRGTSSLQRRTDTVTKNRKKLIEGGGMESARLVNLRLSTSVRGVAEAMSRYRAYGGFRNREVVTSRTSEVTTRRTGGNER